MDLQALEWITLPFGGLSRFDAAAYRAEVGAMLRRELDYRGEAEMLRRFRAVARVRGLAVPEPIVRACGAAAVPVRPSVPQRGASTHLKLRVTEAGERRV